MKTIKILPAYLFIIIFFINSCSKNNSESLAEQSIAEDQIEDTTIIEDEEISPIASNVECVGKVELPPQAVYSIHSKVEGYVKNVYFIEGQPIKKGTILAVLESPAFATLQKDFLQASANYEFEQDNFNRKFKLSESQSVSEKELKKAEMELKAAKAQYNGLKAELELMGFQVNEIEKGEIQKNLALFSPISGYVTKVMVNNGQKISPDNLLFEVIDKSRVHIKMQVNSKDVAKLKEGDKFTVVLPGEKRKYTGELHYINKQIETETNTVVIHGHLDNSVDASELLVGSTVFIRF